MRAASAGVSFRSVTCAPGSAWAASWSNTLYASTSPEVVSGAYWNVRPALSRAFCWSSVNGVAVTAKSFSPLTKFDRPSSEFAGM